MANTANATTTTTTGAYKGVIMLNKPPIDKIAALALLERALGTSVPIAQFWESNRCSPEQMLEWEAGNLLPIDIGDEKYHQSGFGSATERVAEMFELNSPAERKLVELMNKNNQTGNLKAGGPLSVAWSVRELYEFDDFDQRDIVARAKDVVHAYLKVLAGDWDASRSNPGLSGAMPELVQETVKGNFAPFTTSRYLRDLWFTGTPVEDIKEKVRWWLEGGKRAKANVDRAKAEYDRMKNTVYEARTAGGKSTTYILLETADRFLVKAAGYDRGVGVRVVKNPVTGHGLIAGQKHTNLAALATVLEREEPGLWYYARETQTLINGGQQYVETPPTRYSLEELGQLLEQYPPR